MLTGLDANGPQVGNDTFLVSYNMFVQFGGGQVPVDFLGVFDAVVLQPNFMFQDSFWHSSTPSKEEVLKYVINLPERVPALEFTGKYQKSIGTLMVS